MNEVNISQYANSNSLTGSIAILFTFNTAVASNSIAPHIFILFSLLKNAGLYLHSYCTNVLLPIKESVYYYEILL